jgi:hypothetical protein
VSARSAVPLRSRVSGRRLPAAARASAPPLAYLALSVVIFVRPLWAQPGPRVIAQDEYDSSAIMWFLAWWPHAVMHGVNPLITHAIFVPEGYNLTWATSIPGPALALAPVTLSLGPVTSYNALIVLAPALSAWAAFGLCRHVTGAVLPAMVGGYLFGFSPYLLNQMRGAPSLALVAVVPVLAMLILKRLDGSMSRRRFAIIGTAALVAQFLISTEVLATSTVLGFFALTLGWLTFRERRPAILDVFKLIVLAYGTAGVLLSPWLFTMLLPHTAPVHADPSRYRPDLYSFLVPGDTLWHGRGQARQWLKLGVAYFGPDMAYIGLPLLAIVLAFAVAGWRDRGTRLLVLCFAVCVLASLGPNLLIATRATVPLPWEIPTHVPVLRYALPIRFALFTSLAVAVMIAMWLAQRTSVIRWAVAVIAVVSILPNFGSVAWRSSAVDPALFDGEGYKAYLQPRDNVLTVPPWGQNERWQARTRFRFNIVGGYVGHYPLSYSLQPTFRTTLSTKLSPNYVRDVRAYVAAKRVTVILVDKRRPGPWRRLFAPLGVKPLDTGGVLIYRLAPPGGRPALGGSVRAAPTS